ncbi:cytochrome c peroxidase [Cognatiyoonia sp. IB215446]|uniref:cytochrome-c peroxidase n=1 Tax=Cognatiyoonia sp. IB215446 TaxID=3097355 RepID=UPI002A13BE72|nr:cytochrome c peroxidase [Cognatiyoonia sp. IB215446]MDX8349452.1 cytochrome c peroxidase [Cognatiyoonia sp. IB215446]
MRIITTGFMAVLGTGVVAEGLPRALTDADFRPVREVEARLGQLLFYDPILSGNREVSCGTCHHPAFGTGDGLSLGIGDGGIGLGPKRVVDSENMPEQRIPRNAPALFNLGAHEFTVLFHDGRIEVDPDRPGGLRTPLDADMVTGFASLLSAQTMFPVLSADEMAGHYSENDVSQAVRRGVITGEGGAWDIIARRVADTPTYAHDFIAVYDHIDEPDQITFADISNAIAAFMEWEWRSDSAPFDAVLRGEGTLPEPAATGMELFYGSAGCAACHSGPFLTDHDFHAMGAPQIGPGKAARFESHARDEGRFRVTGDPADLYAFRTPSLRNVALTAPYGHAGAHSDLRSFIVAHLDPAVDLQAYDLTQATLPEMPVDDARGFADSSAIMAAIADEPVNVTDEEVTALIAFLDALTDPISVEGRLGIPDTVPSGLPVDQP